MSLLSIIIRLVVLCALVWLAAFDVRYRRLPTTVIIMVGALFFINAFVIRMPIRDALAHLLTALVVLLICTTLFAAKVFGGGDAKLASVVFLWLGLNLALPAVFLIAVLGLCVSLISLATRHMDREQPYFAMRVLAMFSGARGVPYGVALALGGGSFIVLPPVLSFLSMR